MEEEGMPFAVVVQSKTEMFPDFENPDTWMDYVMVYYASQDGEFVKAVNKQEIIDEKVERASNPFFRIESFASFLANKYQHLYGIPKGRCVVFKDDFSK